MQRVPVDKADGESTAVHLSPDNRFVTSQTGGKLTIWRVDGAKPVQVSQRDGVQTVFFAPDRPDAVICTAQREVIIVPLEGKDEPKTVRIPEMANGPLAPHWQWSCQTGPRRQAALAGLNRVRLVDLDAGKITATFAVPGQVERVAWSPDGATVAVSFIDQGVVFYHLASRSQQLVKTTLGGPEHIAFDRTGRFLMVANWWTGHTMVLNVALGTPELRLHISELTAIETAGRAEHGSCSGPSSIGRWCANSARSGISPSARTAVTSRLRNRTAKLG